MWSTYLESVNLCRDSFLVSSLSGAEDMQAELQPWSSSCQTAHCFLVQELWFCKGKTGKLKSHSNPCRLLLFSSQHTPPGNIRTLQCLLINLFSYTLLRFGLTPRPKREESSCQKANVYNEHKMWTKTTAVMQQLWHKRCYCFHTASHKAEWYFGRAEGVIMWDSYMEAVTECSMHCNGVLHRNKIARNN